MNRPSKRQYARRVEEIAAIKLDGAFTFQHLRDFVREREADPSSIWFLGEGASPMPDSTLYRYSLLADKMIRDTFSRKRSRHFHRHVAQRRALYARAVQAGEIAAALRVLDSEASLLGLWPDREKEMMRELRSLEGKADELLKPRKAGSPADQTEAKK